MNSEQWVAWDPDGLAAPYIAGACWKGWSDAAQKVVAEMIAGMVVARFIWVMGQKDAA